MGQTTAPQVVCCQPDSLEKSRRAEITFWEDGEEADGLPQMRGCRPDGACRPQEAEVFIDPEECIWCRSRDGDASDSIATSATNIESLSYTPVRFDAMTTVDAERSHSRYSKIVVHSTRARTQRQSKAWEDWLRAATTGRAVTLLMGTGFQGESGEGAKDRPVSPEPPTKIQAMYYLDRALTKLSILPTNPGSGESVTQPVTILVDNIQVICPLTDFMVMAEVLESQLDEGERARAALLQFKTEGSEQKRVCFLEESQDAKERFVQALTALWLEKRNDHSMWF